MSPPATTKAIAVRRLFASLLVVPVALVGCSSADDPVVDEPSASAPADAPTSATDAPTVAPTGTPTTPDASEDDSDASEDPIVLTAGLTGDAEVPGPGDPGGSGSFRGDLTLLEASSELCYTLDAVGLTTEATAAHIHAGAAGESGGVVVSLTPPVNGAVEDCVDVDAGTTAALLEDPSGFYVNVHSAEFGDGAVRGQLQRG